MKPANLLLINVAFTSIILITSCNNNNKTTTTKEVSDSTSQISLKEDNITYTSDSTTMDGYVVYNENKQGPRPAVLVVHEWWGLNDYPKRRAKELAKLGYVAMAVDLYGNGKTVDNPTDAQNMAMPFYTNPSIGKQRFDAALAKLKTYSQVDTNNIAAIGYCFGGGVLLNNARLGENIKAVVSFHGSLIGTPADKNLLRAKILVCQGGDDKLAPVSQADLFKKQMDSIGADYTLKIYPGAMHSFTNPASTDVGKKFNIPIAYNGAADSASWKDMQDFFNRVLK